MQSKSTRRKTALQGLECRHGAGLKNLGGPPERTRKRSTGEERYKELIKIEYDALKSAGA